MKPRSYARLLGTIVALIALWPIAHRQLVTRFEVNPWKLYGFAMYATRHWVSVELYAMEGRRSLRIHPDEMPEALRAELRSFTKRRRTLGTFVDPDELAETVLAALPRVETLGIKLFLYRLPPRGTRIEHTVRRFEYQRDAGAP